jgi:6-phosphogluconate dehydrogenase (decarboxylating)
MMQPGHYAKVVHNGIEYGLMRGRWTVDGRGAARLAVPMKAVAALRKQVGGHAVQS